MNAKRIRFSWWAPLAAAGFSALQLALLLHGFAGTSGDDFFRALTVYEWCRDPAAAAEQLRAISVLWFPLHFWVSGLLFKLSGHLFLSLTALSMAAYWLSLVLIFHLTRTLFDRAAGWCALVLAGFIPLHLWMGISMTEMAWFYAALIGGTLFLARFHQERQPESVPIAGGFFLAAAALRPEAWPFAGLFSLLIGLQLFDRRWSRRDLSLLLTGAGLPWIFIVAWLIRNAIRFGNPIYFLTYSRTITGEHVGIASLSAWIKALQYPFFMAVISPLLCTLLALGIPWLWRSFGVAHRRHLFLNGAQLALLMAAAVWGAGTKAVPQRYVLGNLLLLVPFAAAFLSRILTAPRRRLWGALFLTLYCAVSARAAFRYPRLYRDAAQAGTYLRTHVLRDAPHGGAMCSELAFRALRREALPTETDFLRLASEHVALMVCSGQPDRMLFDKRIFKRKAELLAATGEPHSETELAQRLRRNAVAFPVLSRRESMAALPDAYRLTAAFGALAVFSRDPAASPAPAPSADMAPLQTAAAPGIRMTGYAYDRAPLPRTLTLEWTLAPHAMRRASAEVRLAFTHRAHPEATFQRIVPPMFRWYPSTAGSAVRIQDTLALFLPPGLPAGSYTVQAGLIERRTGSVQELGAVAELSPVTLVHSKRAALVTFLKGPERDWKLFWKVLTAL